MRYGLRKGMVLLENLVLVRHGVIVVAGLITGALWLGQYRYYIVVELRKAKTCTKSYEKFLASNLT